MVDESNRVKWLEEQFDLQMEAILRSGVHRHVMGEQVFRKLITRLKGQLVNVDAQLNFQLNSCDIPFLIVIPTGLVRLVEQCFDFSWDGRRIKMRLQESLLANIANGRPSSHPYLAVGIDMGCDYRPLATTECMEHLKAGNQSPFFIEEGLALLRCQPSAMLQGRFLCANTRHGPNRQGVTSLQLRGDGFELDRVDEDEIGEDFRFPSCTSRMYVSSRPVVPNGNPSSFD
ncbi:MAG: DUF5701 family protein [Patescibacteria group bacterium]|nr:DUF5701 family protein [Patescibacteria group bacterium]